MEPPDDERRFVIELEFVQCLVNADYLRWLALNKYLEDQAFIDFLKYLQYWKRPDYSRFLTGNDPSNITGFVCRLDRYPNCLAILDLLQQESFRTKLANGYFCELVDQQQRNTWRFYLNNRRKHSTSTTGSSWTLDLNKPPTTAAPTSASEQAAAPTTESNESQTQPSASVT